MKKFSGYAIGAAIAMVGFVGGIALLKWGLENNIPVLEDLGAFV
jgi:hypothetical protein